jgi:GST-like protein
MTSCAINLLNPEETAMLEVWSWPTPNGHKVHIALEELELDYKIIPVNIGAGDQFKPEFLKITPNHRIPAIVDSDGAGGKPFTLFESVFDPGFCWCDLFT